MLAWIKGSIWEVTVIYSEITGNFRIYFRFLSAIVLSQAFIYFE